MWPRFVSTRQANLEKAMTTLIQPLRALARHNDPLLAAGINVALRAAPGIEVVTASKTLHFRIPKS